MAADNSTRKKINGFEPVTVIDIERMAHTTAEQAKAMGAMFRTIARLSGEKEVRELCEHGVLQADLQANDIDVSRDRAMKSGLDMEVA